MGADMNQCIKAIAEPDAYNGPSIIIGYAPCINHGIKTGMGTSMAEEKKAVQAGYWHLYRYNPAVTEGNPFTLDSKDPTISYQDFLMGETRYTSLKKAQPELAAELFERAEEENGARLAKYKNLAKKD